MEETTDKRSDWAAHWAAPLLGERLNPDNPRQADIATALRMAHRKGIDDTRSELDARSDTDKTEARVVYERGTAAGVEYGIHSFQRVGFSIGDRVFWTGIEGPYDKKEAAWERDKDLAEEIVRRWNTARGEAPAPEGEGGE